MKIVLTNGDALQIDEGLNALDAAKKISEGLARSACAVRIDGETKDLRTPLTDDCGFQVLTFEDEDGKKAFWHTTSHVLAQAVKRLYPDTKLAIGPAIDEGFYYDFDRATPFTENDLTAIEKEMEKIVKEDIELTRFTLSREEAIKLMTENNETYKVELINDLPADAEISFYKQNDFTDLCAGPHLTSTKAIKAIKLVAVAGAYWRGSEKNAMLSRIYGISFPKAAMLTEYLERIEEAKKRDHRKLGRELKLFTITDEGQGFPLLLPKGVVLKNLLIDFWRRLHKREGYEEISTPIILNRSLWERSGHWDNYKENMYTTEIEDEAYAIKPMNCPGSLLTYNMQMHSYREFPMRMAELGIVHRHEKSGTLHGLMRVRCFTQDDAHIYMTPEQVVDELKNVIRLIQEIYSVFDFKYELELSTKPEKAMGSNERWELATAELGKAMEELGIKYKLNPGDGAFYGPKIDFHLTDSLGRKWQCGTIQLDFQMPERFDINYIGPDGEKHRPVMIHRTAFGSIERFMGILIEHFAGRFPLWIAPVQIKLLPISDKFMDYCKALSDKMTTRGLRTEIDARPEKIGYKIREAQLEKVPYMLIIGEKEVADGNVSVRGAAGDEGAMNADAFIDRCVNEVLSMK